MQPRTRTRSLILILMLLPAVEGAAGCGSGQDTQPGATGTDVSVHIRGYAFQPAQLQLKAGQSVTFVVDNADPVEHNLTIDGAKVNKDVSGGKTARASAKLAAGTYAFHCEYHPKQMTGTLTVA